MLDPAIHDVRLDGPVAADTAFTWANGRARMRSRFAVVAPVRELTWTGASAQTLDSELLRHDPAPGREDGGGNGEACEAGTWRGQTFAKPCPDGDSF